jgi:hypothetical protein
MNRVKSLLARHVCDLAREALARAKQRRGIE